MPENKYNPETPEAYAVNMLFIDKKSYTLHLEVKPPLAPESDLASIGKTALHLAEKVLALSKRPDHELNLTHTSAAGDATIGHTVLPSIVRAEDLEKASGAIQSALYQTLNGVPLPKYGVDPEA